MANISTCFGENYKSFEENFKRLSKDLGVRYQLIMKDGKQLFRFVNLDQDSSICLISRVRKYGLAVTTVDPLSDLIKDNLEVLN
jgi:hypothetical protein